MSVVFQTKRLTLIKPTDSLLNRSSREVKDIRSNAVQAVIDRILTLAARKGHSSKDSRQMVGLAAVQIGVPLRIISIDLTADGSPRTYTDKKEFQVLFCWYRHFDPLSP